MPFTFAHPVAAIPLYRPLKQLGSMSALVIGSLAPDLIYFLPMGITRNESHGLAGILWFCLPVGFLIYVVFHRFLKGPLLALTPEAVFSRLGRYAVTYKDLPPVSWVAVTVSLFFGTLTHLLWDSFTHWDGLAVKMLPVLKWHIFTVGDYSLFMLKLLQQTSTCVGLLLMACWIGRWVKRTPWDLRLLPVMLSRNQRMIVIGAIIIVPLLVGFGAGLLALISHPNGLILKVFAENVIGFALPTFLSLVVAYCCGWQIYARQAAHA